MKLSTFIFLFFPFVFTMTDVAGQANASINILTQNSGQVNMGGTVYIQVDVGNTGPVSDIGVNKVRAQISVPSAIVSPALSADQDGLPAGWTVLTNTTGGITVCNGTDVIPVNTVRTVLIKIQGNALGGPSTVTGVLSFGPGTGVCTGPGSLPGDITADNTSTSSIQVISIPTPVTLSEFSAKLINCQPELHWTTETEINSDRFEIERSPAGNSDWITIGIVAAAGDASSRTEYEFTDRDAGVSSEKVFYRLKMADRDGKYKYSEIIRVSMNCRTTQVYAYPNPVQNGKLYVSLAGATGYAEATLMSLSGQVIIKNKIHNGTNYLDVATIADGIYILTVKDTGIITKKIKVRIHN